MLDLIILVIRAIQFLFAIIVLALMGDIVNDFGGNNPSSRISFMLFNGVWTMLIVIYLALTPRFAEKLAHPFLVLGLDLLTMLFWFAGFIALAVLRSDLVGFDGYFYVSACPSKLCSEITAGTVFGAFEWLLFVVTSVLSFLHVFRGNKHSTTT